MLEQIRQLAQTSLLQEEAQLKYALKHWSIKLKQALTHQNLEAQTQINATLIKVIQDYLQLIDNHQATVPSDAIGRVDVVRFEALRVELVSCVDSKKKSELLSQMLAQFSTLKVTPKSAPQSYASIISKPLQAKIERFISSVKSNLSPVELLCQIVTLYQLNRTQEKHELEKMDNALLAYFNHCDEDSFRVLIERLNDECNIEIFTNLFIVAIKPEIIFSKKVHAEKLISIKNRAHFLYSIIEDFYSLNLTLADTRFDMQATDLLLHGEELPHGINIECYYADELYQQIATIKCPVLNQESDFVAAKIDTVIRAYKFWFNPSRLVDAVMAIYLHTKNQHPEDWQKVYTQEYLDCFNKLTTNDCLEVFGYFNNKDTKYLMRTMKAVACGQHFEWLADVADAGQQKVAQIYSLIEIMLQSLRQVLTQRCITTEDYAYYQMKENLRPGRRIQSCIAHIIDVYGEQSCHDNARLDALFDQISE